MWSVGCVIYELLTGKILFDPNKSVRLTRDRHHIYDIIRTCGKIPDYLIDRSNKKNIFFTKNRLLKNVNEIEPRLLHNLLKEKLQNRQDFNKEELDRTIDLMYKLLHPDPMKRPDVRSCLSHDWFKNM
jgi:serine/threonine-protein kinase SRPK3